MTRDDLADKLYALKTGAIEATSMQTFRSIFGERAADGAHSLAAEYGLEVNIEGDAVTFSRPMTDENRKWLDDHKAVVEADPSVPPLNAITAEDEHMHRRPRTIEEAKRPLELGGSGEHSFREGSQTDPDAG